MTEQAVATPTSNRWQRLKTMAVVAAVGSVFVALVGPAVLAPADPRGCVSVLTARLGWGVIPLSGVAAFAMAFGVAVLAGRRLEDLGVFAVALGLALAAVAHHHAGYLWATFGQGRDELRRGLAGTMAAEAFAWLVVVGAAYGGTLCAFLRPQSAVPPPLDPRREGRNGALTVLFMSIIAILALAILSSGTELAPVQTGQVCFATAASFYLAALIAYQLTGATSSVWAYLAVGVVAVLGYVWTAFNPTPSHPGRVIAHIPHLAPTAFARALPIQMIMVGTAAAIFGNWHQGQLTRYAMLEDAKNLSSRA